MFIDTHVHLDSPQFDDDREEIIQRAAEQGVARMVNIGFNRETIPSTMKLAETYDSIYAAVGWHPQDAMTMKPDDLDWIESLCQHEKVVAIGEIGLDYYRDTSSKEVQQDVFREQIRLARKLNKPIIIHNREAHQDVVEILKEEKADQVGGVMHCFSGSWEVAEQCMKLGFYISFGGPITFKNAKKPKEVLARVPLDRLLIETDCPYLAPHPNRGKRNEPGFVPLVAEAAAQIKGIGMDEIAKITSENAFDLFPMR